jgi:hypothetical protein
MLSVVINVLICWMSLCWVSLCWMSWRRKSHKIHFLKLIFNAHQNWQNDRYNKMPHQTLIKFQHRKNYICLLFNWSIFNDAHSYHFLTLYTTSINTFFSSFVFITLTLLTQVEGLSNFYFTKFFIQLNQGILKGKVSLYHWPPVWLVWISLFCK